MYFIYGELAPPELGGASWTIDLATEKKAGKSWEGKKNSDYYGGIEKNFLKTATHKASTCRAIASEGGTKTSLWALEEHSRYEKKTKDDLNVGKNLGHCLY